jgi:8-oxo-dGTP pyrophosphatase MutT (NUDIX family)
MAFEIIDRKVIYQGRSFDVHKILARLQDGRQHEYDLVSHRGAVTLIPIDEEGNIWFVRQYRLGAMQDLLELPAGVIEENEAPEISAAREMREEIGMAAREMRALGQFYMAPGYSSEYMHVFLATGLYPAPLAADEDEFLKKLTIPVKKVYLMAHANEIHDGKTLTALLLAEPFILS